MKVTDSTVESMSTIEALKRLAALEEEAQALRTMLEAQKEEEKKPSSLLTKPVAGSNDMYWMLEGDGHESLYCDRRFAISSDEENYRQGNIFQSEALAKAYAEAIETMLLLRHCEGSVVPKYERTQWYISVDEGFLTVDSSFYFDVKISEISPCFSTPDCAWAALTTVGEERILRMFKTFHGLV